MNIFFFPGTIRSESWITYNDTGNEKKNHDIEFKKFKDIELIPNSIDMESVLCFCTNKTNLLSEDQYIRFMKSVKNMISEYLRKTTTKSELEKRFYTRRDPEIYRGDNDSSISSNKRVIVKFGRINMSSCLANTAALYKPENKVSDPLVKRIRFNKENYMNHSIKDRFLVNEKKWNFSSPLKIRLSLYYPRNYTHLRRIEKWFRSTYKQQDIDKKSLSFYDLLMKNRYSTVMNFENCENDCRNLKLPEFLDVFSIINRVVCGFGDKKDVTTNSHNSLSRTKEVTGAYDEIISKHCMINLFWLFSLKGIYSNGLKSCYVRNIVTTFTFNPETLMKRIKLDKLSHMKSINTVESTFSKIDKMNDASSATSSISIDRNIDLKIDHPIDLWRLKKKMGDIIRYIPSDFPAAFYTPELKLVKLACTIAYNFCKLKNDVYESDYRENEWMNDRESKIRNDIRSVCGCGSIRKLSEKRSREKSKYYSESFINIIRDKVRILIYKPGAIVITGSQDKYISSALYTIFHGVLTNLIISNAIEDREKQMAEVFKFVDLKKSELLSLTSVNTKNITKTIKHKEIVSSSLIKHDEIKKSEILKKVKQIVIDANSDLKDESGDKSDYKITIFNKRDRNDENNILSSSSIIESSRYGILKDIRSKSLTFRQKKDLVNSGTQLKKYSDQGTFLNSDFFGVDKNTSGFANSKLSETFNNIQQSSSIAFINKSIEKIEMTNPRNFAITLKKTKKRLHRRRTQRKNANVDKGIKGELAKRIITRKIGELEKSISNMKRKRESGNHDLLIDNRGRGRRNNRLTSISVNDRRKKSKQNNKLIPHNSSEIRLNNILNKHDLSIGGEGRVSSNDKRLSLFSNDKSEGNKMLLIHKNVRDRSIIDFSAPKRNQFNKLLDALK